MGNRLTETTAEGHTTSYSYDTMGRLATTKRPTGGETSYSYDQMGALASETDANGNTTSYVNDLYGRTISRTLPNEATFTYRYDALGRLTQQTGPQGLSKTYAYDVAGNLIAESDQSDRKTTYTYDVMGRLLTAKNALDLETRYSYDEAGNLATVTRPSGAVTSFDYTTLDQLKTITSPTGRTVEASYDPVGQLTKRTINGKREETYTYDPNGNLIEAVNPLGQVTKRTYDALNRLTAESDTAGQLTMYSYDQDSRLIKVTNDEGATASLTYDGNGNLTSVRSGSERLSTYTYDLADQLVTATQGVGEEASTASYTYDSVGNLTSVTNGNGQVTTYKYDQLANVIERVTSLGDTETYTYNLDNQLETVTKADGKTIRYDYNKLDQLLTVDYSEDQDGQVVYAYDADGRRVAMSDLTGTTAYAYNDEGQITGLRQGDGSLIQYSYDDFGNVSLMTYPDGSEVAYTYDDLDRLTAVTDAQGQETSYAYNEAGDLTEVERGDGSRSVLTYDRAHRVTEIRHLDKKGKLISSYAYTYDDGNYISTETITQDGETVTHRYSYDTLGQVTTLTITDKAGTELSKLAYTYDQAGNKLTSTETVDGVEATTSFTYDANNRLIKLEGPEGTISYSYDQNGNRISKETADDKLDYIYDTENRLLAVKDKDGLLMAALYDGDDNRVFTASRKEGKHTYQLFQKKPEDKKGRKSPYTAPGGEEPSLFWYGFTQNVLQALSTLPQTVGSLWHDLFEDVSTAYHQKLSKDRANEDGLVVNPPDLGDLPGEGEVTYASQVKDVLIPYTTREDEFHYYEERNYVNDVNREHTQVLQTYDRELQARETYTYGNGRATYHDNTTGDSYHYLTSQSGSVTGLTKDGQAVASSSYKLYGASKQTTDQTGQPYAYNGEARDNTGLDYLRARYYDSQAGTFLTADSYQGVLTRPLSQNNYSYVENNPVNYIDPSGHRQELNKDWGGGRGKPKLEPQTGAVRPPYDPSRPGGLRDANMDLLADAMGAGRPLSFKEMAERGVDIPTAHLQAHAAYYGHHYANNQSVYNETSYNWAKEQLNQRIQQLETDYQNATGGLGKKKLRETADMLKNWTKALEENLRHICDPNTAKAKDDTNYQNKSFKELVERANNGDGKAISALIAYGKDPKNRPSRTLLESHLTGKPGQTLNTYLIDLTAYGLGKIEQSSYYRNGSPDTEANNKEVVKNTIIIGIVMLLEYSSINDIYRLKTGKDPMTGEQANQVQTVASMGLNIIPVLGKAGKVLDTVNDIGKVTKAIDTVGDVNRTAGHLDDIVETVNAIDKLDDLSDIGKSIDPITTFRNWWQRLQEGRRYNEEVNRMKLYPYSEVHLANGKRLDGYNPVTGEIVSRKATYLDQIQESTFRGYLKEIHQKYAVGTEIRSRKYFEELYGQKLEGQYILEIPAVNAELENIKYFEEIAAEYDVILRYTGKGGR